jgi:hypothetical protein
VQATIKSVPLVSSAVPSIAAGGATTFCAGDSVLLTSAGASGYALQFNGVDQYVEASVGTLPIGNAVFTMELWMKSSSSATAMLLNWGTSTGNQQTAMRLANGHLQFVGGGVVVEGTASINDGNWHHVAMSYDGTDLRLYVDGAADGNAAVTMNTAGTVLRLGRENGASGAGFFTGTIDEVRIWNLSKTATALNTDKNRSVAYDAAGLVVSYRLNEGSGIAAGNALGSNNGVLYNGPSWILGTVTGFVFSNYLWTNGETGAQTQAKTGSNYKVTSYDADGCSSSSSVIAVTVNDLPEVTGVTDGAVCGSGTVSLSASATGGTVNWYAASSGGSSLGSGNSFTTPVLSATTTYYAGAVSAAGCESAERLAVVATVGTVPTITSSTGATVCIEGSLSLAATASSGTVSWYTTSTGGSSFTSGNNFQTPELTETTTYYVDATLGNCVSATRTAVTATVTPSASGGVISGNTTVCAGTNSTVLTVSGTVGTVQWQSSSDGINFSTKLAAIDNTPRTNTA